MAQCRVLGVVVLLSLASLPSVVHGWWDQGHMLVAAVAKQLLAPEELDRLHTILSYWDDVYPGMNSLLAAAVWSDRVKCFRGRSVECVGMKRFDAFNLLDNFHYCSLKYNPFKMKLSTLHDVAPYPGSGAQELLSMAYNFFLNRASRPITNNVFRSISSPDDVTVWAANSRSPHVKPDIIRAFKAQAGESAVTERNVDSEIATETTAMGDEVSDDEWSATNAARRLGDNMDGSVPLVGSTFSWNLYLRMAIHVIGDVHQPLHIFDTFTPSFASSDVGGNMIRVNVKTGNSTTNMSLHAFWDSCALEQAGNWSEKLESEIEQQAKDLITKYPKEFFGKRIQGYLQGHDWTAMILDSYLAGTENAYKFIDLEHINKHGYDMTPEWHKSVSDVTHQQVVLGGYRLALVLKLASKSIPDYLLTSGSTPQPPANLPSAFAYIFGILSGGLTLICYLMYRQIDKLNHKVADNVNLINRP